MRKVLVSFEISATQSKEPFIKVANPDFSFVREFDKDDDKSFTEMCDLEYKVETLVKAFKALGCQVAALKKEVSKLDV